MRVACNRIYRGPLRAAILDWAGTTLDYGCCAPAVVFIDVFARQGIPITMAEAREPMGANKRDHVQQITQMPRVAQAWLKVHGCPCLEADIDRMYADFTPLQLDCIRNYAALIPGTLDAVREFRQRGMKIGSTTGYSREMMNLVIPEAARQGYAPDSTVTASDVPTGRPAPWMALKSAMEMNVFPPAAIVKIGDTVPDIAEGLNAGMWTVGVAKTGNEVGLSLEEFAKTDSSEIQTRLKQAYERLIGAGAHYVIDGVGDIAPVLDDIDERLKTGEKP